MSAVLPNLVLDILSPANSNKANGFQELHIDEKSDCNIERKINPGDVTLSEQSVFTRPTLPKEFLAHTGPFLSLNSATQNGQSSSHDHTQGADETARAYIPPTPTECVEDLEGNTEFASVVRRNSLLRAIPASTRDPLKFVADMCFTPIRVDSNVYQILSSAPGLNKPCFQWDWTLVYNGRLTYSWSLLKLGSSFERTSPIMRPIGMIETSSRNFKLCESIVTDLQDPLEAACMKITHYPDSWSLGGFHVGFQVDSDYRYEWQPQELVPGSGEFDLMLWRINLHDNSETPAARIGPQFRIQNPIDHREPLWSLEVDIDNVKPHLALLTALNMKIGHNTWHAWFAPKEVKIYQPMPLVNFAFQDEGRVYQQSGKFWGDWEDERGEDASSDQNTTNISLIRVFNKAYLKKFALTPKILAMLNEEAERRVAMMKSKCNMYPYTA